MSTPPLPTDVTSDDKLWSALSYVLSPIVPIILLLMEEKKNRPYIRFHAVQSLIAGIALFILFSILSVVTFGCGAISFILWIIMFYWGYKAYQGQSFEIPVVTNFIRTQGWV